MTDFLGQMLRRQRHEAQERKRFYASLNEINPTSLAMIQASQSSAAAAAASSEAALRASMASKVAADAKLTSAAVSTAKSSAPSSSAAKTITPATSSVAPVVPSSSSSSSSSVASSTRPSSSSASTAPPVTSSTSIAGRPVMTITQTPSYATSSSSSSAIASSSASLGNTTADSAETGSTGMSTGGVIGAVAAGLVGLVVIGALFGWLFRKYFARKKSATNEKNWRQIGDGLDGYGKRPASPYQDDIYGQDAAPVIGSRRALALARANAHDDSRPPTMMERNIAGAGAWRQQPDYGPYPGPDGRLSPEGYGMDPHSRPYMQQAGRVPINADQYQYQNAPDTSRQLISPDSYSPSFVPGRPGVPQTDRQIAQHEDFADFPAVVGHDVDHEWMPHTATTNGDWAGQHEMPTPSPTYGAGPQLPMLPPMSPDSFGADFGAVGSQKQMYADVARAAGVLEPVTPTPAQAKYAEAAAASSSSRGLPPLPVYTREAPSPFQHGRPLSALEEVESPLSTPVPSIGGVQPYSQNPFDDAPSTPVSAARYPPPGTPGVPQSVSDDRTWHQSPAPAHRLSRMTTADDDVYGGI